VPERKIVIFVPLHEEMKYIHDRLRKVGFEPVPDTLHYDPNRPSHLYRGIAADRSSFFLVFRVIDAANRDVMGNINAATEVLAGLGAHRPHFAILIGLAGSLRPEEVRLGDVVIADAAKFLFPDKLRPLDKERETFADAAGPMSSGSPTAVIRVDKRKRFLGSNFFRFRRDWVHNSRSTELLARYVEYQQKHQLRDLENSPIDDVSPRLHFGAIFGCDWVVDSEAYVKFVVERDQDDSQDWYQQRGRQDPSRQAEARKRNRWGAEKLLAVDMESFGFLKAAEAYGASGGQTLRAFVVRGISDLAAKKSILDEKTAGRERTRAVHNAAIVALDIIARLTEWGVGGGG
jgi:nucleoside phosphorylase